MVTLKRWEQNADLLTPPVADPQHNLGWIFEMAMAWVSGMRQARQPQSDLNKKTALSW